MKLCKIVIDRAHTSVRGCAKRVDNSKELLIRFPSILHKDQPLDKNPMTIDGVKWSVRSGVLNLPVKDAIVPAKNGAQGKIDDIVPIICGVIEELQAQNFFDGDNYIRITELVFLNPMVSDASFYRDQLVDATGHPKLFEASRGTSSFRFKLARNPKISVYREAEVILMAYNHVFGVQDFGYGTELGYVRGYQDVIQQIISEDRGLREVILKMVTTPEFGNALISSGMKTLPPANVVVDRLARGLTSVESRSGTTYDFKEVLQPLVQEWFDDVAVRSLELLISEVRDNHSGIEPNKQIWLTGGGAALVKLLFKGKLPKKVKSWVTIPDNPDFSGVVAGMKMISNLEVEIGAEDDDEVSTDQEAA